MNITMMLLLLSYKEPVHRDMELVEAPQVVCPLSIWEDRATLDEVKALVRAVRGKI